MFFAYYTKRVYLPIYKKKDKNLDFLSVMLKWRRESQVSFKRLRILVMTGKEVNGVFRALHNRIIFLTVPFKL